MAALGRPRCPGAAAAAPRRARAAACAPPPPPPLPPPSGDEGARGAADAVRWAGAPPSGRRLVNGALAASAIALGGNFGGCTSALLSAAAPAGARAARLDVLFPVGGFTRCYRPDQGFEFVYPRDWAADQTLARRAAARAELERGRSLDPPSLAEAAARERARRASAEPVVAFGPVGTAGEENVSVIVTPATPGFTSMRQLVAADNSAAPPAEREAEYLLRTTIAPEGSGKVAELLGARERVDAAGRSLFEMEYTVRGRAFYRHNVAVLCVAGGRLLTLNAQAAEEDWQADAGRRARLRACAESFAVVADATGGVPTF